MNENEYCKCVTNQFRMHALIAQPILHVFSLDPALSLSTKYRQQINWKFLYVQLSKDNLMETYLGDTKNLSNWTNICVYTVTKC